MALGTPDFSVWDGFVFFQGASSNHEGIRKGGKRKKNSEQESVEDGDCSLAVGAEKGLQIRHPEPGSHVRISPWIHEQRIPAM